MAASVAAASQRALARPDTRQGLAPCSNAHMHRVHHSTSTTHMQQPGRPLHASQSRARFSLKAAQKETCAPAAVQPTEWFQRIIELPGYPRGCHIITRKIQEAVPELGQMEVGMANLFIQHTSASLTINENASPDVPLDLNDSLDRIVPEGRMYRHLDEGLDDMPAHVKSSLMGPSLSIPVGQGRLVLGTWQGIYLNEHRDYGGPRRIVITVQGQRRADGRSYR